jgi:hypothetical protein
MRRLCMTLVAAVAILPGEAESSVVAESTLRIAWLHDSERHAVANRAQDNYWDAYIREILDQLGLRAEEVSPDTLADAERLARYATLLVGDLDTVWADPTLLQRFENVSDAEVVERTKYDLRWKAVFDLDPLCLAPLFAKSTLQLFRLRLVFNEEQGLIFDGVLAEAKRRGLLPKALQAALDTSPVRGRGAVQDAFNLLSDSIGAVLRAVAKKRAEDPAELARALGLERHLQRGSVKGTRPVDWDDPESVRRFLAERVADCGRAVGAAKEAGAATEEVALLAKVVAENVEETPAGPQIPQKVAKGRTASVHDPEMRHGHKSTGKLYTGHKAHLAVETTHRFITAIEVSEPASPEGEHVASLSAQSETRTGSSVSGAPGDCA